MGGIYGAKDIARDKEKRERRERKGGTRREEGTEKKGRRRQDERVGRKGGKRKENK